MGSTLYQAVVAGALLSSAVNAQTKATPFGPLERLVGAAWSNSSNVPVQVEWETPGEVLVAKTPGGEGRYEIRFRRGLDGKTVLMSATGLKGDAVVTFPSAESWSVSFSSGLFDHGCRFASRDTAMCEAGNDDGTRRPYQMRRLPVGAFAAAEQTASQQAAAVTKANEDLRARWGLLIDLVGRDFAAQTVCGQYTWNGATRVRWNDNSVGQVILLINIADPVERPQFIGRQFFLLASQPGTVRYQFFSNREDLHKISDDGTVAGLAQDYSGKHTQEVRRAGSGAIIESFKIKSDGSKKILCTQSLSPEAFGFFDKASELSFQNYKAKKARGSGLAATVIGGLAEVAKATSPDYNPYAGLTGAPVENPLDENNAQNRQFRENMARIASGRSAATPTPVNTAQQASSAGGATSFLQSARTSQSSPVAQQAARPPFRFYLAVVPAVKESDASQPQCVSSIITAPSAQSFLNDFVQRCASSRGDRRVVSTSTVNIYTNEAGDDDLEGDYNRRIRLSDTWKIAM